MISKSYTKIVWNLNSNKVTPTPLGVTSDTGRGIEVRIKVDEIFQTPENTLRLAAEKEDGTAIYLTADIVSGRYLFTKLSQLFSYSGKVTARLELQQGTDFISSENFVFEVPPSVAMSMIQSSSDFTALQKALSKTEAVVKGTELIADQVQRDYNKVTTELVLKANKANTYTKEEVDTKDALKADKADTYTKSEVDGKDELKADLSEIEAARGTEATLGARLDSTDEQLAQKADKNIIYQHPLLTGVDKEVKIFDGYFRSFETGGLVPNANNVYSELIPVVQGSVYKAKNIGNVVFFDVNENYLSGMNFTTLEEERHIDIPENASYASFSSRKANKESIEWTRIHGNAGTFNISQKRFANFKTPAIKKIDFKNGDNLFNPRNIVKGFFYDYGGVPYESIGVNSTGFIKVNAGVTLEKNVAGHVSVYDKNFKYITGWIMENVPVQITLNHEDIEYINLSFSATKVIPENVKLLYIAGDLDLYEPTDKLILKENQNEEIKENVSSLSMANSKDFLRIPTPYTDGTTDVWSKNQATHPSTVQFSDNWNGYKYWMAYTPYPYQRDQQENPCIAASNDGLNWVTPDEIVNPLDTPEGIQYNSDTHLLYRSDLNQLEVWYRGVKSNKSGEIIKRVIIDSDLNVSAPEDIIETSAADFDNSVLRYISPSIIFEDGKYKLWMMREWVVHYTESSDLLVWSDPVKINSIGEDVMTWHPNVVKHNSVYYLFNDYNSNTLGRGGEIRYSTSLDGINFTKEKTIIKHQLNQFKLDGRGVYRATPLWLISGSVGVIYGMVGYNGVWTLGMSVGEGFYNLEGIDTSTLAYMGK